MSRAIEDTMPGRIRHKIFALFTVSLEQIAKLSTTVALVLALSTHRFASQWVVDHVCRHHVYEVITRAVELIQNNTFKNGKCWIVVN